MSFLTDLVEGHTSNLGNDLSHAGSSLMNHPTEMLELGGAAALGAAPFLLPELGGALGVGGAAEGGGMLGGLFGGGADAAAGIGDAAAAEGLDTSVGLGYGTSTAADTGVIGGAGAGPGVPGGSLGGAGGAGGATPAGFAATDAELGGGITGVGGAAPAPPQPGFMDSLSPSKWTLGGVGKVAGVAAAGAGLGMNMLRSNQMDPNQQKLQDLAGQLGSQGQVLESYLKTGKLPPALQTQLDQAKASEKARIISGHAARGQPTDPNLNSALAQELNNVDTNAIAAMAQVQVQMLNTGLKETGMSMELYTILTKMDEQQNQDLMKSISSFAAALGGGFGGAKAA